MFNFRNILNILLSGESEDKGEQDKAASEGKEGETPSGEKGEVEGDAVIDPVQ